MGFTLPSVPDNAPTGGNGFTRWLGRTSLRLLGWRIEGALPDYRQLVLCGAPHTSNWDFILSIFTVLALGLRFSYVMKKEAFFWPMRGLFLKLGGIPLDRSSTTDVVEQIIRWYRSHDKVWLAITPEGTRSKVDKWKTGFLRIAYDVGAPVKLVSWDYSKKILYLDKMWQPTGDHVADAEMIRDYVQARFVDKS